MNTLRHSLVYAIALAFSLSCTNPRPIEEPVPALPSSAEKAPQIPAPTQPAGQQPAESKPASSPVKSEKTDTSTAKPAAKPALTPPAKKGSKTAVPAAPAETTEKGVSQPVPEPVKPAAKPTKTECGADLPPENFSRQDVYKNRPFQAGESAKYDVSYMGIHAGFGNIDVEPPIKYEGIWHQVFSGHASTGEWYERIFIVKDKIRSVSRPWDFGAAQFYIEQDEGSLFGRRFRQKKWISYDHNVCKAYEKQEDRNKKIKEEEVVLEPGADDAMSAYFELRTLTFNQGQTERILVYTSEKNWFLDAKAVAFETVEVPAGKFKAVKLELKTFLGKELQQKGDVYMWIATEHPARPMVKVEAEVKIGRVSITLNKFTEGRP